jgi:uncharacterized damage-inducible protein DinB
MTQLDYIALLARYNGWMNRRVFETAGSLPADALREDRGAFFGSILGTLNHLMVADILWLRRFAAHPAGLRALEALHRFPAPGALDQILYEDFAELRDRRFMLDDVIIAWCGELTDDDLTCVLDYRSMKGISARKELAGLILHMFNHQTHHRGQVTTLLSQAGLDVGATDLVLLLSEAGG